MNINFLHLIIIVLLCIVNASCATSTLVDSAKKKYTRVLKTGNEIEDIHIFLKENIIVAQYVGEQYIRSTDGREKLKYNVEAIYDIKDAIKLSSTDLNSFITKPIQYKDKHNAYKQENGWTELPLKLMVSNQIDKESRILDRGSDSTLRGYMHYILRNQYEVEAYRSLIDNAVNTETSIWASVFPSDPKHDASGKTFDRRAVFIDKRDGKEATYILMMPLYKARVDQKEKLILLPATLAIDIVTAPISIPMFLLIEGSGLN